MPAAPRLRQVRRDKAILPLMLNVARLDLEEDDRLALSPALRDAPDADLRHLQNLARYWLGLALIYLVRKYRCSPESAAALVNELRDELADTTPETELRAVSLREALNVPLEKLPAFLRPDDGRAASELPHVVTAAAPAPRAA